MFVQPKLIYSIPSCLVPMHTVTNPSNVENFDLATWRVNELSSDIIKARDTGFTSIISTVSLCQEMSTSMGQQYQCISKTLMFTCRSNRTKICKLP